MIVMYNIGSRQQGKSLANIALIKILLRKNPNLEIGCYDVKATMIELRQYFPTAIFIVKDGFKLKIKIIDTKELEL